MLKEIARSKEEKTRCQQQYPDWKDNEFNCGPLKYIFGIQSNGEYADNFNTLNDLDIYFNRDTKKYLLNLDISKKFNNKKDKIYWLRFLLIKFANYLPPVNFVNKEDNEIYSLENYLNGELFIANSLIELYYNFSIFINGYISLIS